jgi:hypothetical protein
MAGVIARPHRGLQTMKFSIGESIAFVIGTRMNCSAKEEISYM